MVIENNEGKKLVITMKDLEQLQFLEAEPKYRVLEVKDASIFDN